VADLIRAAGRVAVPVIARRAGTIAARRAGMTVAVATTAAPAQVRRVVTSAVRAPVHRSERASAHAPVRRAVARVKVARAPVRRAVKARPARLTRPEAEIVPSARKRRREEATSARGAKATRASSTG
jgi:hypothetical protein